MKKFTILNLGILLLMFTITFDINCAAKPLEEKEETEELRPIDLDLMEAISNKTTSLILRYLPIAIQEYSEWEIYRIKIENEPKACIIC